MKNTPFFAFATSNAPTNVSTVKKLYVGIAPIQILAVNPTAKQLEEIYGNKQEKEPVYISEVLDNNTNQNVKQVRVDYFVKTVKEDCGIETISKVTFFLKNTCIYNRDKTKICVINIYGQTAYLPIECMQKNMPIPANMQWFNTKGMRAAYNGEEAITGFMKEYLGIPDPTYYKEGQRVFIDDLSRAEVGFDHIKDWFNGDFTELNDVLSIRPENKVFVLMGVKTTGDNKQYQHIFSDKALKIKAKSTDYFMSYFMKRKEAGAFSNIEFDGQPIHEYTVNPTTFSQGTTPEEDPLAAPDWSNWGN